ncbi:serine protease snake-like [Leptopilina heterotoma]|uniref:serine protease snake-like n=1 Tax=Leptopilina heterotoma TaxID=63436 RepID=UPI001CA809BD|nr:serine protease snake-like [Leptopilina heterotoma]XP_043469134.1 serine protease snake-like [Leptopilina heterotoma]
MYFSTSVVIFLELLLFRNIFSQFDLYEGDDCTTKSFTGKCLLLRNCPSVYQDLVKGKRPEKICSFLNSDDVVVCCPSNRNIITTTSTTTTTPRTTRRTVTGGLPLNNGNQKRIAATKCEEYARSVYALVIPPTLAIDPKPVNISLCGIKSKKLIVGGVKADPKEFPHMAVVGYDDDDGGIRWLCGGTLVSEIFVLTAAHCTYSVNWGEPKWVRVGDLNILKTNEDAKPQERRIERIIKYPHYKQPSQYHDIALIRMNRKIIFDAYVRPACLPLNLEIPQQKVIATGWGLKDSDDETGSDDLLKVTLSVVATETCNISYRNDRSVFSRGILDNLQLCAGEVNKDTCQGDSGGPLSIYNREHDCMYSVIGITSIGKLCGINIPGVYTKVYGYLSWLEQNIWG